MAILKIIRYGTWAAATVLVVLTAAITLGWWQVDGPGRRAAQGDVESRGGPQIGGPFTLVDHRGKTVTDADFRGKPMLVFFGFTYCPDVCPTTLWELSELMKKLGPDADKLTVVFISVDPERDTPEAIANYLTSFDPRIVGLTGAPQQIDAMTKLYRAYYKKVPTDGGSYTMDHTATVYLMDQQGRFAGTLDRHEKDTVQLDKLRRLIARGES